MKCPSCGGKGRWYPEGCNCSEFCPKCGGSGEVEGKKPDSQSYWAKQLILDARSKLIIDAKIQELVAEKKELDYNWEHYWLTMTDKRIVEVRTRLQEIPIELKVLRGLLEKKEAKK